MIKVTSTFTFKNHDALSSYNSLDTDNLLHNPDCHGINVMKTGTYAQQLGQQDEICYATQESK